MSSARLLLSSGPNQISFKILSHGLYGFMTDLALAALRRSGFQERHFFFGKQPAIVKAQRSGCLVDGFEYFDLFARDGAAFFETPRGHEDARFERAHAFIIGVECAIEVSADVVEVICKHAQAIVKRFRQVT